MSGSDSDNETEEVVESPPEITSPGNQHPAKEVAANSREDAVGGDSVDPAIVDNSNTGELAEPSHIVGIGASAGGLSALQGFFDQMPHDSGAAFVVVQHLSPNFKTLMDELLSRHSRMSVKLADDNEKLEANHVYVLRPNRNISICDGRISLVEIERTGNPNLPIDKFFSSLARDLGRKAVGIVLSGTGSDGSVGIKSLREVGGLVLVQDPADAEFDGMPLAAIRTGYVDSIADINQLTRQLVSYLKNYSVDSAETEFREHLANNPETIESILKRLNAATGVDFSLYKPAMVSRRFEHRMWVCNARTLPEYAKVLDENPGEFNLLKSDLLIGVTQFFRDQEVWIETIDPLITSIIDNKPDQSSIRVWMVGVSSGEEVYSLAMLLSERLRAHSLSNSVKIFATDVNSSAVEYASYGVYPPQIGRDISPERLERFFTRDEGGNYVVNRVLRNMVVFATHNVLDDPPFSNMDLVVCRNMLIYLLPEAQERVLSIFNFSLRTGGYLWLGSSESLTTGDNSFKEYNTAAKVWSKVSDSKRVLPPHIALEKLRRKLSSEAKVKVNRLTQAPVGNVAGSNQRDLSSVIRNRVLEEFGPTGVLLGEDLHIRQIFGDCSRYMGFHSSGQVSTHINVLLNSALMVPVATCVARLEEERKDRFGMTGVPFGTASPISLSSSDDARVNLVVDVTVSRLRDYSDTGETLYLLLFSEPSPVVDQTKSVAGNNESLERYDVDMHTQERLRELDLQLLDSRQELRNAYAELDTTSEELQSTNEELMAANEELQSTNEELQSVNEELYSVNTEYQEKIAELMESNTDLDNLLNSTGYGIIFLDSTLAIRRYTPKMARYIHLLPGDIERPITDFQFDLEYKNLVSDLNRVLQSGEVVARQVKTVKAGTPVNISINPYISSDNSVNGVVMTVLE